MGILEGDSGRTLRNNSGFHVMGSLLFEADVTVNHVSAISGTLACTDVSL